MILGRDGSLIVGRSEPASPEMARRLREILTTAKSAWDYRWPDRKDEWDQWSVLVHRSDGDLDLLEVAGLGYHTFPFIRRVWRLAENQIDPLEVMEEIVFWEHDRVCDVTSWPRGIPKRLGRDVGHVPMEETAKKIRDVLAEGTNLLRRIGAYGIPSRAEVLRAVDRSAYALEVQQVKEHRLGPGRPRCWRVWTVRPRIPGRGRGSSKDERKVTVGDLVV